MMTHNEFKQARRKLGLTQSDLGAILDTDPRTIRRWEQAERPPNPIACQVLRWMSEPGRPGAWPDPQLQTTV